jgi:hypothetical protein
MENLHDAAEEKLLDYYRMTRGSLPCTVAAVDESCRDFGFFHLGGHVCYGHCQSGTTANVSMASHLDASKEVLKDRSIVQLPFSFAEIIDNLRLERYRQTTNRGKKILSQNEVVRKIYYLVRAALPASLRRQLQRAYFRDWQTLPFPAWPIDSSVDRLHQELLRLLMEAGEVKRVPFIWFWPDGATSCLIMTHDVETAAGRDFTSALMDLDGSYGIPASFQVIPEQRYEVSDEYIAEIRSRGFEFNIHDLNHDGRLYRTRQEFVRRAAQINGYIHDYGARGFRAGSMYRKQEWYDLFEFSYDMSVPNVAHLEPMRGGCCTVMPYFVGNIVELPLTMVQDYSLLHILGDYSTDLWKRQMAYVREANGLISFIVHPDYLIEKRARRLYESLLDYLRHMVKQERVWTAPPGEVDLWWRARRQMSLVRRADSWEITGPENERARLAYAVLEGDRVVYELPEVYCGTTVSR